MLGSWAEELLCIWVGLEDKILFKFLNGKTVSLAAAPSIVASTPSWMLENWAVQSSAGGTHGGVGSWVFSSLGCSQRDSKWSQVVAIVFGANNCRVSNHLSPEI
ncbi:hypothetical protein HPP92_005827 [Vanilla planifolia]|uniref:Uncharacterized protein n=1 Tax=Vanilla planifolia TaxID=51239 RepID=A0A835RQF0_VANPL|nr:hypothetical protein HPP92_005827 [Vanilla planifolia]